jgi:hypothetical protein
MFGALARASVSERFLGRITSIFFSLAQNLVYFALVVAL